jgi:hypothetical protein
MGINAKTFPDVATQESAITCAIAARFALHSEERETRSGRSIFVWRLGSTGRRDNFSDDPKYRPTGSDPQRQSADPG